jgi:hypothetical protein
MLAVSWADRLAQLPTSKEELVGGLARSCIAVGTPWTGRVKTYRIGVCMHCRIYTRRLGR